MSAPFTRTGVFATKTEAKHIRDAASMPYIVVGGVVPENPQVVVHRVALEHGLPEIPGYYGIDLRNREFIRA